MTSLLSSNTFDPNEVILDLSGKVDIQHIVQPFYKLKKLTDLQKVYVVTGGSAGIGFGIVTHLLHHNAGKIYLLSQKAEHADEATSELKNYGDHSRVE